MSNTPSRFFLGIRPQAGIVLLLFVVTAALFWPARGFDYVDWDDYPYVAENALVQGGLSWDAAQQAFVGVREQWWLPLLWISYMADVELFGPGPQGHHLTNVLLHAVNAGLLFWVLFRLTGARWKSAFVAALFAWHPTRVEAVAWIAARKDVLSGLFFLLALLAYARHAERPSARRMAWVSIWMLLGLMSKAILVVLPPLLLLLDAWPLRRAKAFWGGASWQDWKPLLVEKALPIALAAIFMGLNLWTHRTGRGAGAMVPALTRLGMMAPNIMDYLGKIAVPIRLNVFYPDCDAVSWPWSLAAWAILGGATGAALLQREKRPYVAVGWLWFLVALLPVLRGVRLGLAQYADRWTYLPLIGLAIAGIWTAAEWAAGREGRRRIVVAAGVLALAACAVRTQAQLPWWRNSLVLFQRAAYLAPESPWVQNSLGKAWLHAGQVSQGLPWLEEAVRRAPLKANYRTSFGVALQMSGDFQAALAQQDEAIRTEPGYVDAHVNRGIALLALGRATEAQAAFEAALRLEPAHGNANFELGGILFRSGRYEAARACYVAACRAGPNRAVNWYNLGLACEKLGHYAEAKAHIQMALRIDPRHAGAELTLMRLDMLEGFEDARK